MDTLLSIQDVPFGGAGCSHDGSQTVNGNLAHFRSDLLVVTSDDIDQFRQHLEDQPGTTAIEQIDVCLTEAFRRPLTYRDADAGDGQAGEHNGNPA